MSLSNVSVLIANGTALSAQVNLGAKMLVGIHMPASWTAAGLSFQVSPDGGTTWNEMQTISAAVAITAAAAQYIAVDPSTWRGANCIKVRSGTLASAVNQGADRTLTLVTV